MRRIDTRDGLFHDGNPATGELGTLLSARWLNGLQQEVISVIEEAGIQLDEEDNAQLLGAIQKIALDSPFFIGIPRAPTAVAGTKTQQIATTEFVDAAVHGLLKLSDFVGYDQSVELTNDDVGHPMWVTGTGGKTIRLPPDPPRGSTVSIHSLAGGDITIAAVDPRNIYACRQVGVSSVVLKPQESLWLYYLGGSWVQLAYSPSSVPFAANAGHSSQADLATNVLNGLGIGQSWVDVTASRIAATTYTNSTGKPIFVFAQSGAGSMAGYVNGVECIRSTAAAGNNAIVQMIIPVGATYSVTTSSFIYIWSELR